MPVELRVNWVLCDGFGLCSDLLPEAIDLDDWSYPVIAPGPLPEGLEHAAQRAVDCCPMKALRLEIVGEEATAAGGRRRGRHFGRA
jgi:ferredoxin